MSKNRSLTAILVTICNLLVVACERAQQAVAMEPEPLIIQYVIGGIWGPGAALQVSHDHLVLESARCPVAQERTSDTENDAKGFCVVRISEKQWEDFVRAMEPYRRHSVRFDPSKIIDRPYLRPDGEPCRNVVTDQDMIGITWFDQNGARYAQYYEGCDQEELGPFYDRLRAAMKVLPVRGLVEDH